MSVQLDLSLHGALHLPGTALGCLGDIAAAIAHLPIERAGTRLRDIPRLKSLLAAEGPIGSLPARWLGGACRPVRALLFDKSPTTNWNLGWHQDRVIAVESRVDTPGFGHWTVKQGMTHVMPPFRIMESMITVRVHLDDVGNDNAPLLIAPGSHRMGCISEDRIEAIAQRCGTSVCLATAGDVWLYSTPILHASRSATQPKRRRVLQADFAAVELPGELRWLGI